MNKILKSTVFRLTLRSSLVFLLIIVCMGWLLGMSFLWELDDNTLLEQEERVQWLTEIYQEDGLHGIREEFGDPDETIWDEDHAFFMLTEEGFAVLLLSADNESLFGFPALRGMSADWTSLSFFDDEEHLEVRVLQQRFSDGVSMSVGQARSDEYFFVSETMQTGFFWLCVIVLPLAIVIGLILSRKVYRRLNELVLVAEEIGHGSLDQRAPLQGKNDEFDRLASTMNAMLDRIQSLHLNLETASAGMAHDLKTPLSRLSNRMQLLQQDKDDPAALGQHLQVAQAQLHQITNTLHNLLRLSEIESGQRRERFIELDVSAVIGDVLDSYEPVFTDAGRTLQVSLVPGIRMRGDADLLVQMLTNLLENSIEHGRPGGRTWVRLQGARDGCVLQVGDDGPGVPDAEQSRIFERFFRGDISRGAPGNGLGLSIVKAVCELHGGSVALLEQHTGAVFDCHFPAAA